MNFEFIQDCSSYNHNLNRIRMSSENLEDARTWYFKASSVAYHHDGPERVSFDPNFFSHILDARRPCQIQSISKADTICFSAASKDQNHAIVEGFIHASGNIRRGTAVRWLKHA